MVLIGNGQKRDNQMPETLKLNKGEQEALRKKSIELNKMLIKMDKAPIRESELAHIILDKTISYVTVSPSGNITIGEMDS